MSGTLATLRAVVAIALLALSGCVGDHHAPLPGDVSDRRDHTLPYHPLVYHLDLSVLAYHLHAQTLIWPFDPFYENLPGGDIGRARFMSSVRAWAAAEGREQTEALPRLGGYRGPGRLAGFDDNPLHDPIVSRYRHMAPWDSAIANGGKKWVEYRPSAPIADRIRDVHVCFRPTGQGAGSMSVGQVATRSGGRGQDTLLAFEGNTGDKGEAGHPGHRGILGFVLLRDRGSSGGYDAHIAFRGSRSGSLLRAVAQANWDVRASGNPDWITDLGYRLVGPGTAPQITRTGSVHRGFARSLGLTLPNLFGCLEKAARLRPDGPPKNVFVTGHSLGGGLAQHFASTVLLGGAYGPMGAGPRMPDGLKHWPWSRLKLITFGAPRAGDERWARALTVDALDSEFHARDIRRFDHDALTPNDPGIVARLADDTRPAAYRVLASTDAVSTSAAPGRKPVGKTVYVDKLGPLAIIAPYSPDAHDPEVIRDLMVKALVPTRSPDPTWQYIEFADLGPTDSSATAIETYEMLYRSFRDYHRAQGNHVDLGARNRDYRLFTQLLERSFGTQ